MKFLSFVLVVIAATFNLASAECVCQCVNGKYIPLCSSSIDVQPVCAPKVCPLVSPSVQPLNPPTVPPVGTSHCSQEQVFNETTGKYEWRQLCY